MTLFMILFITTMAISLIAMFRVQAMYAKYSRLPATSGYTGAQAAAQILHAADINDVHIECHNGMLSDHYNPLTKTLVLSEQNYYGTSTAALGISAHETGHAIQHKISYAPLQWRMAAVGATTYANQVVFWLPLLGMFTGFLSTYTGILIMAIAWGLIMTFNLITLPVEFDASRRAKLVLAKMNFITTAEERTAVDKVLDAAALTYLAAFITSLLYFLWYLLPLLSGRRD